MFGRVSLQEPVLRGVGLRFRWTMPPRYSEVRGTLAEILMAAVETADDWYWDFREADSTVYVSNQDARMHARLSPRELKLGNEIPDTDALKAAAHRCLKPCLDTLNRQTLTEVGCAAVWMMAAESTATVESELEGWLFRPSFRKTMAPLGGQPDDLTIYASFGSDGDVASSINIEPITDEQASKGNYFESNFMASEFPPAALVTVIQRWQDGQITPDQGVDRAAELLAEMLPVGRELLATIQETHEQPRD